ncbi:MAG: ABC transporter permease [Acholeplasmataceae bacterium]
MNKNIMTMIKKELTRVFTDRRMVISLLLPGILVFVLYSIMGNFTSNLISVDEDYEYQVYVLNQPTEFTAFNQTDLYDIHITDANISETEILAQIEDKDIDLYIVYQTDFYQDMLDYLDGNGLAPQIEIFYNSTSNESSAIYSYYVSLFSSYESQLTNAFDMNAQADVIYDQATDEDMSILLITYLLPFLLMTFLFSGAMSVASESIAGEKERGTIATLLMTPTKRSEIALGKIISLSIITLVSAASSFAGVMLSLPKLFGGTNVTTNMYSIGTYILLFIVIISTVLIYVVLLSIVSAYAKTIKEAASLAVPFMMLNMLIGISSMLGVASSNIFAYFIPLYNSVQSITSILSLTVNPSYLAITIGTNLVVVFVGVWMLTKMFNSEKVMFNK